MSRHGKPVLQRGDLDLRKYYLVLHINEKAVDDLQVYLKDDLQVDFHLVSLFAHHNKCTVDHQDVVTHRVVLHNSVELASLLWPDVHPQHA
ncbi:hypothetical protein SEUCBS139899_008505 [Sporothrix eucalyptigena]